MVNFGVNKVEYMSLNEAEKAFIMKEYEEKKILDSILIRNAFLNAYSNANRKKNTRFIELFKKRNKEMETLEQIENIKAKVLKILGEKGGKEFE